MLANKSILIEMAETPNGLIRSQRIRHDPAKGSVSLKTCGVLITLNEKDATGFQKIISAS